MNKPLLILFLVAVTHTAFSQTPTDGLMMDKGNLCTGFMYTFDQWKNYWEGDLKRENGNIGKITTQSNRIDSLYVAHGEYKQKMDQKFYDILKESKK